MKVDRRGLLQAMSVGAALAPVLSLNSAFASESDSSGPEASPGAKFVQMDPNVRFDKQIANNVAPVVLLSTFLVKHEHELGHLAIHRGVRTGSKETEDAANLFASAFLGSIRHSGYSNPRVEISAV
jgi:hypothetical protein